MNTFLRRPFNVDEIKLALASMGDLKAPGPDGMPAIFFKRFWDLVGPKVRQEILGVLNGGPFPSGWNKTVIVLIPKVLNPERIKDLRPISLCNLSSKSSQRQLLVGSRWCWMISFLKVKAPLLRGGSLQITFCWLMKQLTLCI